MFSDDEDCLVLNVWAPQGDPTGLPVMVWLHGGAFIFGSGGEESYDGALIASTYNVVVVTVNYRLGGFGFLAHPALTAEDPAYPSSGNYGIDDQIAALQWVQRNIAQFRGDPAKVTLFGESAGGISACTLYVSPLSAGLFRAVIAESGPCSLSVTERTLAQAEAAGVDAVASLGCTGPGAAACLRGKTAAEILAVTALFPPIPEQMPGGPFWQASVAAPRGFPNVDGRLLPATTAELFAAGSYEKRPMIYGVNKDEGTLFHSSFFARPVMTTQEYEDVLATRFDAPTTAAILEQYPAASFPDPNRALAEITGDFLFACPVRRSARAAALAGAPVYFYSFETEPADPVADGLGVFHSGEIPFVFGNPFILGAVGTHTEAARHIRAYWTRFATTLDPNGGDSPVWPRYDATTDTHLTLLDTPATSTGFKAALCDFWDAQMGLR